MMPEKTGHLTEEALQDVLIGLATPESEMHLAECLECRAQVDRFRSSIDLFNEASLAWSKSRLAAPPRPSFRFWPAGLVPATLVLAVLALIVVPAWKHHRPPQPVAPVDSASTQNSSEAQIAEDNQLLAAVNVVLNESEQSPVNEYHLLKGPLSDQAAGTEARNR
jgi:hypothetical protein